MQFPGFLHHGSSTSPHQYLFSTCLHWQKQKKTLANTQKISKHGKNQSFNLTSLIFLHHQTCPVYPNDKNVAANFERRACQLWKPFSKAKRPKRFWRTWPWHFLHKQRPTGSHLRQFRSRVFPKKTWFLSRDLEYSTGFFQRKKKWFLGRDCSINNSRKLSFWWSLTSRATIYKTHTHTQRIGEKTSGQKAISYWNLKEVEWQCLGPCTNTVNQWIMKVNIRNQFMKSLIPITLLTGFGQPKIHIPLNMWEEECYIPS